MNTLRDQAPQEIGAYKVTAIRDYKKDTVTDLATGRVTPTGLPASNVLYYEMTDGAWVCVRPSGTEPKVKFYLGVKGNISCGCRSEISGSFKSSTCDDR